MNTDPNAALTNRLILLVLSLILVCLVLLVVRAYVKPGPQTAPAVAEAVSAAEEPTSPAAEAVLAPPGPVRFTTNVTRSVQIMPRPVAVERTAPPVASGDEPAPGRNTATVDYVGVGVSSSPGLGVGGGAITLTNGEIYGVATLFGTPKPEGRIDLGPACGRINPQPVTTRHYVVGQNRGLANVFVEITRFQSEHGSNPTMALVKQPLLDQVGCLYEPYVLGVMAGQKFKIRNSDPEMHNVHATPRLNPEFNFGQPVKGQVNEKSFDQPEVFVRMKCDVHPWMFAYIGVVQHPWFAVTDTNGFFQLPRGLASGRYTVTATHLKAGAVSKQIDFRSGEPLRLHFQFGVPDSAQPQDAGTALVR